MATVGSMAMIQLKMAQASAKTGVSTGSLFSKSTFSSGKSTVSSSDAMENILKGKNDYFKAQYKKLYNSIFPDSEDTEKADKTVTVKSAANSAAASADALADYANGLGFDDKVDTEAASKKIQSFVDDYNDMIGALSESENQSVLQKGVIMVNTAKVYSSALKRAGVTVGSDNKLSFDKDKLTDIKAYEFKSTLDAADLSSKVNSESGADQAFAGKLRRAVLIFEHCHTELYLQHRRDVQHLCIIQSGAEKLRFCLPEGLIWKL